MVVLRFDTTYVPAGTSHRFRNASATEPMRILWVYASVDATRTVAETGVTARVDAEHDQELTWTPGCESPGTSPSCGL
ncbi:cupin domain-containing protein [Streptomyces sp. NPDC087226]|uniref:cupin domain-containing protein n=1 Tax=Streptomyces sp. NPDC087226 TaxID=3365771 RepID=UPI0038084825